MQNKNLKILIGLHKNVKELDSRTFAIASKYGLSFSQFMVLEALYSKGKLSISEVRDAILSSVGTISLVITNLEKMGYINQDDQIYKLPSYIKFFLSLLEYSENKHRVGFQRLSQNH